MKNRFSTIVFWGLILFIGCKNEGRSVNTQIQLVQNAEFKSQFGINPQLKDEFWLLDTDPKLLNQFQPISTQNITSAKRTNDIHFATINNYKNVVETINTMECQAYLRSDKVLSVVIRHDDIIDGKIIYLNILDSTFQTSLIDYLNSCIISPKEKEPIIFIKKQMLTLDKETYQLGDSIWGHIYIHAIREDSTYYYTKGHFRTKIKDRLD